MMGTPSRNTLARNSAGASDVGHLPVVETSFGRRIIAVAIVGIALQLGLSWIVGRSATGEGAALAVVDVVHAVVLGGGLLLAFYWIACRPFVAAWRDREQRLRDLLRSRAELDQALTKVFETAPVALAFLDENGHPVRTNGAFRVLLDTDRGNTGKSLDELLKVPGLGERVSDVARGSGSRTFLTKTPGPSGPRTLNITLTAVAVPGGSGPGAFVSIEDETVRWAQWEELRKVEDFYCVVVEESRDMILRLSPDGRVLLANSAGRRMLDELGENSRSAFLPGSGAPPEDVEKVRARRAELDPKSPSASHSASVVLSNGQTRRIEWSELGFFDGAGNLTEIHAVGRDVTEFAEARLRLEESEARYRTLFTGSLSALLIGDPATGKVVDANPGALELTGYTKDELRGKPVGELIRAAEGIRLEDLLPPGSEREGSTGRETVLVARDGSEIPVDLGTGRMAEWDGRPLVLLSLRDISARKSEEAARAARDAKTRALYRAAPVGVGLFRQRICLEISEGFTAVTGYTPDELVGRSSRILYSSDEEYEKAGRDLYDTDVASREGVGQTTVQFRRRDGRLIDVLLVGSPFETSDPKQGLAVAVLDVTEKRSMEAEMRKNDVLVHLLAEHAPAILWTTDEQLEVTSALGAPLLEERAESDAPRRSIEELFGGAVLPEADIRALHRAALESGRAAFVFERKGRFFDASVEALRDAAGGARGLVGVAFDTSARRIAEERSNRRWRQLQVLHSIARAALGPAESRQVFCAVAAEIRREFRVPLTAISLVNRREGRTILAGVSWERRDPEPEVSASRWAPFEATLAGEVVRTGQTLFRAALGIAGRPVEAGLEAFAIGGYVGTPLRSAGEVVGVLSLAGGDGVEVSEKDVPWLEAASEFVALVVERRQAGDEVLKLSRAVEQSRVAVLVLDSDARIEYANRYFFDATGFAPADVLGRDPDFLRCQDHVAEGCLESRKALDSGQEWSGELPIRVADGSMRWASVVHSPVKDGSGRVTNVVTVAEDVTERKLADEELQRSREKLRALWARLATLQEDERRALAQGLHEGLGQTLAGIAYGMSWVGRRLGPEQQEAAEELSRLGTEANLAIEEVRKLTRNLRPATLDLDPVAALETEIGAFRQRTGIPCTFSSDPESFSLDADRTTVLYRVLQEGLRNAALHGDPDEIEVRVRLEHDVLRLEVADDGRGIDRTRRQPAHALGLRDIRERVASVGGELRVESNRPRGTLLVAEIPVAGSARRRL
jgi:PAS domain S-box-containing protein